MLRGVCWAWGAYQRNGSSEPRLLHFPLHRKAQNVLTWDIRFSLINSNLLMFWLLSLCCKNSSISWLPALRLWGSQSEWAESSVSWAGGAQKVHWIKHNSQLLGCVFFFFFSSQLALWSGNGAKHFLKRNVSLDVCTIIWRRHYYHPHLYTGKMMLKRIWSPIYGYRTSEL